MTVSMFIIVITGEKSRGKFRLCNRMSRRFKRQKTAFQNVNVFLACSKSLASPTLTSADGKLIADNQCRKSEGKRNRFNGSCIMTIHRGSLSGNAVSNEKGISE